MWEKHFAKSFTIPQDYLDSYREIDGRVYSGNEGIGSDEGDRGMELKRVANRGGVSALLTGFWYRADWNNWDMDDIDYLLPLEYRMVFEDGTWKCSGIQVIDEEQETDQSKAEDSASTQAEAGETDTEQAKADEAL
ncbi:hypothetical protein OBV_04400 [Oscillibacter valericigenes Sjm18-20]|nr:hypothetical protein OBV_04400 [Oscillibacter valericigenes Sjm18-20]